MGEVLRGLEARALSEGGGEPVGERGVGRGSPLRPLLQPQGGGAGGGEAGAHPGGPGEESRLLAVPGGEKGAVRIDRGKVAEEARYDGKWVLRTNTDLPAWEVALACKGLLEVERFFRAAKDLLETRPIFHKFAATICGHIFVSFLALVLVHELKARLKRKGVEAEWKDLVRDLLELREVEVLHGGRRYLLRPPLKGVAGKVLGAVPPPAREVRGAKTDVRGS